jgi:hypothetical protein
MIKSFNTDSNQNLYDLNHIKETQLKPFLNDLAKKYVTLDIEHFNQSQIQSKIEAAMFLR